MGFRGEEEEVGRGIKALDPAVVWKVVVSFAMACRGFAAIGQPDPPLLSENQCRNQNDVVSLTQIVL